MKADQSKSGVVFNRSKQYWQFTYYDGPVRTSHKLPVPSTASREEALREAEKFRRQKHERHVTVKKLVDSYMRSPEMPRRVDSYRGYKSNIEKWILPKWGEVSVSELRDHPGWIKLWIDSVDLAPMSKARILAVFHAIFNYAMVLELIPFGANPVSVVKVKGATEPRKTRWTLSKEEFDRFIGYLEEPFRTIAILTLAGALRISEALALRWSSISLLEGIVKIRKGMVNQQLDDVKTKKSRRIVYLVPEYVRMLERWMQQTLFREDGDWVFASPYQGGRLPYAYGTVLEKFKEAAAKAGIEPPDENGTFGTHILRHSARTMVKKDTKAADVQRDVLGHSSVAVNQDVYGEVLEDEVREAFEKHQRRLLEDVISGDFTDGNELKRKAM